jgi:hypothetical protein
MRAVGEPSVNVALAPADCVFGQLHRLRELPRLNQSPTCCAGQSGAFPDVTIAEDAIMQALRLSPLSLFGSDGPF